MLVGIEFARQMGLKVGDLLLIYSPEELKKLRAERGKEHDKAIMPDEYEVRGIFDVGYYEYNASVIITSLEDARKLYVLDNSVHGLLVMLHDPYRAREAQREIMDAALRFSSYSGEIRYVIWPFLREICDIVAGGWKEMDSGIWEVRGGPHHFVYSKVMCWVALDRGLKIARRHGFRGNLGKWEKARDDIRSDVLQKGWSDGKHSFVQHYGTEELDASALLIPVYGFLPFNDPRVVATAEAISRELGVDGFLYRYRSEDALAGKEGAFLACTFWFVENLIARGKLYEAEFLLHRTERCANALGLFSEQYDPVWKEALGNFPQALTHIGYINCVLALVRAKSEKVSG